VVRRVASLDAPGGFNPAFFGMVDFGLRKEGIEIPMSLKRRYATKLFHHPGPVG